jgi:hypothetical protein
MTKTVAETLGIDIATPPSAVDYWNQPFAVSWVTSHFSGTFCFATLAEAFAYIDQQWAAITKRCAAERYFASNLRDSKLVANGQIIPLKYVLLCDDVSSY